MKFHLSCFIFLLSASVGWAATATLHVQDQNGNPLAGAQVAAVTFGASGDPDGLNTAVGFTDAGGNAALTLADGRDYFFVATAQGYSPTIKEQIFSPTFAPTFTSAGQAISKTFALTSGLANVGKIQDSVTLGAAPRLVLGDVSIGGTQERVAFGIANITAVGGQTFTIFNVPTAPGGTYQVNAFVPQDGKGVSRAPAGQVDPNTTPGLSPAGFNFTVVDAVAPNRVENTAAIASGGKVSFEGIVLTTAGAAVPDAAVFLFQLGPATAGTPSQFQTQTDAGGRYTFYDLPISTYGIHISAQGFTGVDENNFGSGIPLTTFRKDSLFSVNGSISGKVTLGGAAIPFANVTAFGDPSGWNGMDFFSGSSSHSAAGFANANVDPNGNFTLSGLAPGNYQLQVFSPFSQLPVTFNDGPNGVPDIVQTSTGPVHSFDDLRVTLSTVPTVTVTVYSSTGVVVPGLITINIPRAATALTPATISGTLTFDAPVTISTTTPITVLAHPDFQGFTTAQPAPIGFQAISGGPATSFTFSLSVTPLKRYFLEAKSQDYGILGDFNRVADLTLTSSVSGLQFRMAAAGRIQGVLRLPDGSLFKPLRQGGMGDLQFDVNAHGENVESFGFAQVQDSGLFEITGLLPGRYSIRARQNTFPGGPAPTFAGGKLDGIVVKSGQITMVEVPIPRGVRVQPSVASPLPPATPASFFRVVPVPTGEKIDAADLKARFLDEPDDASVFQGTWPPLVIPPGRYDFYLVYGEEFGPASNPEPRSAHFFGNFLGIARNVRVPDAKQAPGESLPLPLESIWGNAALTGRVSGKDAFRKADAVELQKDFFGRIDKIIPAIVLQDANGNIRGFSNGVPPNSDASLGAYFSAAATADLVQLKNAQAQFPLTYYIDRLPAGRYTSIATTLNYPPVVKPVTLAGNTNTVDINFDLEAGPGGSLRGTVKDAVTGAPIPLAVVSVTSRNFEKRILSEADGSYELAGLPQGLYKIVTLAPGYALSGERLPIQGADVTENFSLTPAPGFISGVVYAQRLPFVKPLPGARIVAYDNTLNVQNPKSFLPLFATRTDDQGLYLIPGTINGHTYKVSIIVPGKLVETQDVAATNGAVTAKAFALKSQAPVADMRLKMTPASGGGPASAKLIAKSPKKLLAPPDCRVSAGASFDPLSATLIPPTTWPDNTWVYAITPPNPNLTYTARIAANDGANQQDTDITFSLDKQAQAKETLEEETAAGGQVNLDAEGDDPSGVEFATGGIVPTSATAQSLGLAPDAELAPGLAIGGFVSALPGFSLDKADRNLSSTLVNISSSILASDVYTLALTNTQLSRSLTLTLAYDKSKVDDPNKLRIYQWNPTLRIWELVQGAKVVDPISGTVSVDAQSVSQAAATSKSGTRAAPFAGLALNTGAGFAADPAAATSQTGTFAVFSGAPSTNIAYTGTEVQLYNFPNPFNLDSKTLPLKDGGALGTSLTTVGTVIRYGLPSSLAAGPVLLHIYNLAGELVKTIDEGTRAPGFVYYAVWDGKNEDGDNVASGVYFGVLKLDGKKQKIVKLVVLK